MYSGGNGALNGRMNSTDGVNRTPSLPQELGRKSVQPGEGKALCKTAEEYVAIENRLAVHHEKPTSSPQFTSIFDQLRDRLPR